jgi:hypothetical protein
MQNLDDLKPGDVLFRRASWHAEQVRVLRVDDDVVLCTPAEMPVEEALASGRVWTFDRTTGDEIDIGIEFGPVWQPKGTWLARTADETLLGEAPDQIAERILGPVGRMIAASKTRYGREHPDHLVVFNANVCVVPQGKLWHGDLDLTFDEELVAALAGAINDTVYVLYEQSARFARETAPVVGEYVVAVSPDGAVAMNPWVGRSPDGRLVRQRRPRLIP